MPALLTTMSRRPKWSSAACAIFCADAHSATESVLIAALPPASSIRRLVSPAGVADCPSPASEAPMSLISTLAPARAIAMAISRPMPPPAPVTTATLPSTIPAIRFPPKRLRQCRKIKRWKPVYGQLKRYRVGSLFAFAPAFARKIQEPLLVRGTYSPLNRVTRNRKFEDSPLEGAGFELPVPRENGYRSALPISLKLFGFRRRDLPTSRTEVSNPFLSTGESGELPNRASET